jgi:hypothetical protein
VRMARFSTQPFAGLSWHRRTPSDIFQRPRPTIGVEDGQLLSLES